MEACRVHWANALNAKPWGSLGEISEHISFVLEITPTPIIDPGPSHQYAATTGAKYIRERTRQYRAGHSKPLIAGHMSITPDMRTPSAKTLGLFDKSRWQSEDPAIVEMVMRP